jgi:hypothetical protein
MSRPQLAILDYITRRCIRKRVGAPVDASDAQTLNVRKLVLSGGGAVRWSARVPALVAAASSLDVM